MTLKEKAERLKLELIRDWEGPRTTFYEGHWNTARTWASVCGYYGDGGLQAFMEDWKEGKLDKWFKVITLKKIREGLTKEEWDRKVSRGTRMGTM